MPSPSRRRQAAASTAVFVAGAFVARTKGITRAELRCFRAVNALPKSGHVPVWVVMQLGSLGGALLASAAAGFLAEPRLGRRMAIAGSTTWLAAKTVKPFIRRDRPAAVIHLPRILGRQQGGLGYPSGHAAVAASLAAVAARSVPPRWQAGLWIPALVVGPARVYVGAHLPLDVVGGVALGVLVATAVR